MAHFNSHFWSISFSSIKKYERFGRTPLPPPCNVAAGRYKNQDSIKMSFVQHCCREGGAPARKRYKIAAESPRLLVTMECQNACKESATSTVIAFESQRNTVTQWETQWSTQWNRQWNTPWNAVIYSVSSRAEPRLSALQRILDLAPPALHVRLDMRKEFHGKQKPQKLAWYLEPSSM